MDVRATSDESAKSSPASPATSPIRGGGASFRRSRPNAGGRTQVGWQERNGARAAKKQPEVVKTWAFDSVGNRKYALQIRKAGNGNPCLKVVEGVPQPDGTFRRFDLTFWSEDWPRLFEVLDEVRGYLADNNIRTPDGHKYEPGKGRNNGRSGKS